MINSFVRTYLNLLAAVLLIGGWGATVLYAFTCDPPIWALTVILLVGVGVVAAFLEMCR